jgi:hypothetical protein
LGRLHARQRRARKRGNLLRFNELSNDEFFCTESAAKQGVTFKKTALTVPLVALRYYGPEANPNAPAMGAYKNQ